MAAESVRALRNLRYTSRGPAIPPAGLSLLARTPGPPEIVPAACEIKGALTTSVYHDCIDLRWFPSLYSPRLIGGAFFCGPLGRRRLIFFLPHKRGLHASP